MGRVEDRFLHSRFGRLTTIDPLAEKYPDISPYSYCKGNPVNRLDVDGRIDWKVTGKGILTTISGIGAIASGAGMAAATGGLAAGFGAFVLANGIVSIGVGASMVAIGLTSDPSAKNDEIMDNLPTDTINAVAKSADYILRNDNNEVENAVSAFGFAYDVMTFRFYKIQNVQDVLEFSGDISNFALYVWDDYGVDSENQPIESRNMKIH